MTYLDEYLGRKATEEDIEHFWKHTQEEYDGFCPPCKENLDDGCYFDGTCKDCWNREIDKNH